jgi:uncharacterized protein
MLGKIVSNATVAAALWIPPIARAQDAQSSFFKVLSRRYIGYHTTLVAAGHDTPLRRRIWRPIEISGRLCDFKSSVDRAFVTGEENKLVATFFWRRLDQPGHDCCRLLQLPAGWKLQGMTVFREGGQPCSFAYEVSVDSRWKTRSARIMGFRGKREIGVHVRRTADGQWRIGTLVQRAVAGCTDIDLGFTPATNMLAIRRLKLRIGEQAEAPAAWLSLPSMKLRVLPQTYLRSTQLGYHYEAPTFGYNGRLHVSRLGAVVRYPGLFALSRA